MAELTHTDIREKVRERYAAAATAVAESTGSGCCGAPAAIAGCGPDIASTDKDGNEVFGVALYDDEGDAAPRAAVEASLGCGVPTAVADLHEGETVLDLGSGAGADVLISARRVGDTGTAIGLDMTDEMLELARANAAEAGVTNVEFLKGYIEDIPLPDDSVDVVISNCVINLAGDKRKVLAETARVLAPRRPLRRLRRDRRPRHGRRHARRHGAVDRLHRRCADQSRVRGRARRRGPREDRVRRDPPRARARELRDRPRPQAGLSRDGRGTRRDGRLPALARTRRARRHRVQRDRPGRAGHRRRDRCRPRDDRVAGGVVPGRHDRRLRARGLARTPDRAQAPPRELACARGAGCARLRAGRFARGVLPVARAHGRRVRRRLDRRHLRHARALARPGVPVHEPGVRGVFGGRPDRTRARRVGRHRRSVPRVPRAARARDAPGSVGRRAVDQARLRRRPRAASLARLLARLCGDHVRRARARGARGRTPVALCGAPQPGPDRRALRRRVADRRPQRRGERREEASTARLGAVGLAVVGISLRELR